VEHAEEVTTCCRVVLLLPSKPQLGPLQHPLTVALSMTSPAANAIVFFFMKVIFYQHVFGQFGCLWSSIGFFGRCLCESDNEIVFSSIVNKTNAEFDCECS
jgi:hypothetical protein